MEKSISFDRAAGFYDETRGHPVEVSEKIAISLAGQLPSQARLLEVGIGTGRISRPLLAHGLRVTGIDLSRKMMDRFRESLLPGDPQPDLVQADAAQIPLTSRAFDAVIAVHILHLIPGWQSALEEMQRLLRPGGSLLVGYDWRPPGTLHSLIRQKLTEILHAKGRESGQPGVHVMQEVRDFLAASGAREDEWVAAEWETYLTPAGLIERLANKTWSSLWSVPDDVLARAIEELRAWASQEYSSLDQKATIPRRFIWQRFRWEG